MKEYSLLVPNWWNRKTIARKPNRDGFGTGLVAAAEADESVVALCADLAESTRVHWFKEKFPERYVEMGVAEQNLAAVASGMAAAGKIPFIASYATFSPGRNNEQIRTTIALNNVPVKIIGAHAGVSVGPDGATHQALEDIALMRVIPRMTVLVPCDAVEAEKATIAAAKYPGPVYIRLAREATPVFTTPSTPFKIGKASVLLEGKDVTIIACGALVYEALQAAHALAKKRIRCTVINNVSVKPLDARTILDAVKTSRCVVTVEEHQVAGGMGSAVVELLAKNFPVPVEMVGVNDRFGESGPPEVLLQKFGLTAPAIIRAVTKVLVRKKKK